MSKTLFKEQAVDSCPDGWSCAHCGDDYSEKTVDVEDYYVLITDEGTLCLKCYELENSTLECDTCGYTLHGDTPSIVITCDNCIAEKEMFENMNTEERLEEVVHWVIEDLWEEISKQSKSRVIRQLKFMGYPTEDLKEKD